jgi:hypothetical protein
MYNKSSIILAIVVLQFVVGLCCIGNGISDHAGHDAMMVMSVDHDMDTTANDGPSRMISCDYMDDTLIIEQASFGGHRCDSGVSDIPAMLVHATIDDAIIESYTQQDAPPGFIPSSYADKSGTIVLRI